jgi:hypothetical protein
VQQLVAGAVPGLEKKAVSVVSDSVPQGQAASQRLLAQLGPVTVTRASLLPLKLMVGVALLLNVVLVGLLGMLWKRARRLEQRLQGAPTRSRWSNCAACSCSLGLETRGPLTEHPTERERGAEHASDDERGGDAMPHADVQRERGPAIGPEGDRGQRAGR